MLLFFATSGVWGQEDPTRPAVLSIVASDTGEAEPHVLRLQGVYRQGSTPRALINDEFVRVGERTPQFTLRKIFNDSVEIERADGEVRRLWLTAKIKDKR